MAFDYKTDYRIDDFFEYVVPPLEGLWWTDNAITDDFTDKSAFQWIAMIRVPDPTEQRLGFVIVDDSKRGRGLGKALVSMAVKCLEETWNCIEMEVKK